MIHPLFSPSSESNCYIVSGKKTAVIDAGINPSALLRKVEELGLGVDYLINTHCHFDHVGGDYLLMNRTGAKLCVHEEGAAALEGAENGRILSSLFYSKMPKLKVGVRLVDGQILDLGDVTLEVFHTPGHAREAVCLYEPKSKSLFSGDTVFSDGIGRTDFTGGSMDDMKKSLQKLMRLHEERGVETIYPGHGPEGDGDDIIRAYEEYFQR
jgi:glyoxylase-like metal-dependent hydrolase (beta-lactamase superfamily II)